MPIGHRNPVAGETAVLDEVLDEDDADQEASVASKQVTRTLSFGWQLVAVVTIDASRGDGSPAAASLVLRLCGVAEQERRIEMWEAVKRAMVRSDLRDFGIRIASVGEPEVGLEDAEMNDDSLELLDEQSSPPEAGLVLAAAADELEDVTVPESVAFLSPAQGSAPSAPQKSELWRFTAPMVLAQAAVGALHVDVTVTAPTAAKGTPAKRTMMTKSRRAVGECLQALSMHSTGSRLVNREMQQAAQVWLPAAARALVDLSADPTPAPTALLDSLSALFFNSDLAAHELPSPAKTAFVPAQDADAGDDLSDARSDMTWSDVDMPEFDELTVQCSEF